MTLDFAYGAQNKNNGNVQSQAITRQGALLASLTYGYDTVNRLTGATGPTGWSQDYNYDQYGNRTISPAQQTAETPTGFQSNNRVSGWHYDFAGNVVGIPVAGATTTRASCVGAILPAVPVTGMLRTSCYDGEGHMVSETDSTGKTSTYEYDGQGRRVRKTVGTVTTTYVYDAAGQLAAEYGGEVPADSGTRYLFTDHLGSTRLTAKGDGTDPKPLDYYPFGEEVTASGTPQVYPSGAAATALDAKFTGKLRDAESGLDFFEARYYSSVQGRFTSPDEWAGGIVDAFTGGQVGVPGPLPYADISDPQTINKYAYVRNNPMRYTDPDGHCFLFGAGAPCSFQEFRDTVKDRIIGGLKFEGNALLDMTVLGQYVEGRFEPSNAVQEEAMGFGEEIKPEFQQAVLMTIPGPKGEKGGTGPYQRPSNATTPAQRSAVQGQPCALCGARGQKNVAGHKTALVDEHYATGTIDKAKMRAVESVRPECATCSSREGAYKKSFSQAMKRLFFGNPEDPK